MFGTHVKSDEENSSMSQTHDQLSGSDPISWVPGAIEDWFSEFS
jgi:hypothetical protein